MMKTSHLAYLLAFGVFFRATVSHADLVPPGGEGVSACRDKKAGDACQNFVIKGSEQIIEPGTCVEEKLDHLRFKFRAHLRCVSASVPGGSASAAAPRASVAPMPSASALPSVIPTASAASPSLPATVPSTSPAADTSKSSGCSLRAGSCHDNTWLFTLIGMGLLVLRRRITK